MLQRVFQAQTSESSGVPKEVRQLYGVWKGKLHAVIAHNS